VKKNGLLPVGKIVGAHGVEGNLKVHSDAESLSVFNPGSSILVARTDKIEKNYTIKWAKPHGRRILLSFEGIGNRNAAKTLIGSNLLIERAALPEPEEGSYYWCDIIGLAVFTTDEQCIGRVESIISTGSNDVFVVKDSDKGDDNEILIPALESVVLKIDFEHKTMHVALPEGL
jgi:16S rRNA processing protein RimM